MTLSDRIQLLLDKTKTSQSELEKILGFGKGTITKWKGTTAPSADKLQKIAEHFGVTIDYLMTGRTDNNIFNPCRDCGLSYNDNDPDGELCKKIISKYGTLSGIPNGESVYHIPKYSQPQTLAAHFDGKEYTEDELDEIQKYADFVKSKRKL